MCLGHLSIYFLDNNFTRVRVPLTFEEAFNLQSMSITSVSWPKCLAFSGHSINSKSKIIFCETFFLPFRKPMLSLTIISMPLFKFIHSILAAQVEDLGVNLKIEFTLAVNISHLIVGLHYSVLQSKS